MGKKFLQIFLPYADIQEQAVCCERGKRVLGALVHDYEISGGHIDRGVVDFVDQCAAVYIIQLKIVMAVFRIGLIYIMRDQEYIASRRELTEHRVEVLYFQDTLRKFASFPVKGIRRNRLRGLPAVPGRDRDNGKRICICLRRRRCFRVEQSGALAEKRNPDLHIGSLARGAAVAQPVVRAEQDLQPPVCIVDRDMAAL